MHVYIAICSCLFGRWSSLCIDNVSAVGWRSDSCNVQIVQSRTTLLWVYFAFRRLGASQRAYSDSPSIADGGARWRAFSAMQFARVRFKRTSPRARFLPGPHASRYKWTAGGLQGFCDGYWLRQLRELYRCLAARTWVAHPTWPMGAGVHLVIRGALGPTFLLDIDWFRAPLLLHIGYLVGAVSAGLDTCGLGLIFWRGGADACAPPILPDLCQPSAGPVRPVIC